METFPPKNQEKAASRSNELHVVFGETRRIASPTMVSAATVSGKVSAIRWYRLL